jgi:hypothetical protein
MPARELLRLLRARPFEAFRIYMSDGKHYDIRHPELAIVETSKVIVGVPGRRGPDEPVKDTAICSLLHITRVEFLNGRSRKAS